MKTTEFQLLVVDIFQTLKQSWKSDNVRRTPYVCSPISSAIMRAYKVQN